MSKKLNCWEYEKCGREPDGAKADELGVCPAASDTEAHGLNEGEKGGRICWAIAGTFCHEKVKGEFAKDRYTCMSCDFFKMVNKEEPVDDYDILTPEQLKEFLSNRKKR